MTRLFHNSHTLYRLLTLAALLLYAAVAGAQSLGLVPAELRANFKGGQPVQFDLTVANDGATPVVMRTSVMDLWYNEKHQKVFGTPGSLPRSAANWIEVVPRNFTVPARSSGRVKVVITPPLDLAGGYYAVLFVESKPELAQAATAERKALYTNLRLGALILLSAAGTENYQIELSEPRFVPPAANQNLKLEFQLANKSNTHIFPQAKLAILNARRQLVASAESEPKRFFPDEKDSMSVSWTGTPPAGDYVAILTIIYGNDKIYTQEFPFTVQEQTTAQQNTGADK